MSYGSTDKEFNTKVMEYLNKLQAIRAKEHSINTFFAPYSPRVEGCLLTETDGVRARDDLAKLASLKHQLINELLDIHFTYIMEQSKE
jgi:hypothetical protein